MPEPREIAGERPRRRGAAAAATVARWLGTPVRPRVGLRGVLGLVAAAALGLFAWRQWSAYAEHRAVAAVLDGRVRGARMELARERAAGGARYESGRRRREWEASIARLEAARDRRERAASRLWEPFTPDPVEGP